MHITHIIPTLSFGGAERTVVDIINRSDKGFRFSVIVFSSNIPLQEQITRPNVEIICVPKKGKLSLGLVEDIKKTLRQLKPDVVHTHLFGADVWGRMAARSLGIPVVTTEHNKNYDEGFIKLIIKRVLKNQSDQYAACSRSVRQYMVDTYHITQNIEVIRPGVFFSQFGSLSVPSFTEPFRFVVIGRMVRQKGHEIALEALSRIDKKLWNLTVVGTGPMEVSLKHLCHKFHIEKNVQFQLPQTQVEKIYAAHDVVLIPSRWEGLGIVAMEALSSGRLVVASKVGGLTEIIKPLETGLLCEPNVQDFQKRIEWIFSHVDECKSIAQRGQLFAQENFGIETMIEKYEHFYRRAKK